MIEILYKKETPGFIEVVLSDKHVFVEAEFDQILFSEELTEDMVLHEELEYVELKADGSTKQYYTANELELLTVKKLKKLADKKKIILASSMTKDEIVSFLVSSKLAK